MTKDKAELHQLEKTLELAPCGIALFITKTEEMVFVNEAYCNILGYSKKEYLAMVSCNHKNMLFYTDWTIKADTSTEFDKNGKVVDYEYRVICKDNSIKWIKMNVTTVTVDDTDYAFASFIDITKEKETYAKFAMLVENTGSSVSMFKVQGKDEKLVYANEMFFEMIGVPRKDYEKNIHFYDNVFVTKEDHDRISKAIQFAYESNQAGEVEHQFIRADGKHLWVNRRYRTIKLDEPDSYMLISVVTDCTEKKEAEIKARLEQRRFEIVAGEMNTAVIEWDAHGENFYSSSAFQNYAISKVPPLDILNNVGPRDIVHPDDQKIILKFFNESALGKDKVEVTLRLKMIDGSFHWCRIIGFYYRDENGKPTHTIGVIEDVNEEHERNFELESLLNALPGGVAVFKVSDQLECQYFSDGFASMTGRTRDEVSDMLRNPELLKQGIPLENYYDFITHLKENKETGKTLSFIYHIISKEGEISWLHVAATMIHEEQGNPVYYCIYTKPTDEAVLYRNIVEDAAIATYVSDKNSGLILYANQAFSELCGLDCNNIAGKTKNQILKENKKEEILSADQIMALSYDNYSEFHVLRENGLYLAIKAKALKWNGVDAYILYIADETTEYKNKIKLKENLEELEKEHIKEKTLLSSIPGGLAVYRLKKNGQALVEYASEGFAKLSGYTVNEILAFDDINVNVVPEDIPMASMAVKNAIENNEPIHILYRIRKKNGEIILNRLDANIIIDAPMEKDDLAVLYAVQTKVTDDTKKMLQEQKHYRHILDMLGIAYWEWSEENGFYTSTNYLKYELSKYSMEDIKDNKIIEGIVHTDDLPSLQRFLAAKESEQNRTSIHLRMLMKDGTYQWTEMIGFRELDVDGNPIRMSCILRDINEEWERQKKVLQIALDKAKAANEAKTMFISRISHDMRTPLNGILGLTAFLKDVAKDEQEKKDISQLEITGQYLRVLINDTLDISRIENGRMELHPIICDGKTAFCNLIQLVQMNVEMKNIEFVLHADNIPFTILYIDLERVEQVIMNIIGNAIKFTPENGKIIFTIQNIYDDQEQITVNISIQDTGIGMDKEFLPHIFDAFSQEDKTMTNSKSGTGLGMAITKYLVELMNGELSVVSELGKGSCFNIILPMTKANSKQIEDWNASQKLEEDDSILEDKRILLCEDNPLNQEIVERIFEIKNIRVDTADNGKIGLDLYQNASPGYYDVIMMDVNMPVMDGITATRNIRKLKTIDAESIPIIALTGNSFDDDVIKCLDAGMSAHLSKPIDTVKMFATIKEMISEPHCYRRKKILLVNQTEQNRDMISTEIEEDYDIVEVKNNSEALLLLQKENEIDAIITDIMADELKGIDLIKNIRNDSKYDNITVIVNTRYGDVVDEQELRSIGANEFVYKTTTPEIIERQLRRALRKI